jgi:curved DNA-binding protein CbpA
MTQRDPHQYPKHGLTDVTCYDLLDIKYDADDRAIRAGYLAAVKRHHPDANPHDRAMAATRFRLIQEAYDLLRDPARRHDYDADLRAKRWYGSMARNDNLEQNLSDVVTHVRSSLERLMRLMSRERDIPMRRQGDDHG